MSTHRFGQWRSRAHLYTALSILSIVIMTGCSSGTSKPANDADATDPAHEAKASNADKTAAKEPRETQEKGDHDRVTLTEAAVRNAAIMTEPVHVETDATVNGGITIPGQVEFDPARVAVISPRTAGRLERLLAVPGQRVTAGQTVALLYSPAFIAAQTDFVQATRRSDGLAGTTDADGAYTLMMAARRRLELLGARSEMIDSLARGGAPASLLPLPAPFSGSILETTTLAGAAVETGTPVFKIVDLSVVTIVADVPERAAFTIHLGQHATIRVSGVPDRIFDGRIVRIGDQMDAATRTLKAYIQVPNRSAVLKAGMFATVALQGGGNSTSISRAVPTLTIPSSAIVTDGAQQYVFVEAGPATYERRPVTIAPGVAPGMGAPIGNRRGWVTVVDGVTVRDRIVTRGAFTLKSELAKAAFADED